MRKARLIVIVMVMSGVLANNVAVAGAGQDGSTTGDRGIEACASAALGAIQAYFTGGDLDELTRNAVAIENIMKGGMGIDDAQFESLISSQGEVLRSIWNGIDIPGAAPIAIILRGVLPPAAAAAALRALSVILLANALLEGASATIHELALFLGYTADEARVLMNAIRVPLAAATRNIGNDQGINGILGFLGELTRMIDCMRRVAMQRERRRHQEWAARLARFFAEQDRLASDWGAPWRGPDPNAPANCPYGTKLVCKDVFRWNPVTQEFEWIGEDCTYVCKETPD